MNLMTIDELKEKGFNDLDKILKIEPIYVKKNKSFKYVILSEVEYNKLIKNRFTDETLYSDNQIKKGKYKEGSASDLFKDLDI